MPSVPRFTGNNFDLLSINMQTVLRYNGLEYWIMNGFGDPYDDAKDTLVLYLIKQAIDDNIFHVVAATNMAKEAWESLKNNFGQGKVTLINNKPSHSLLKNQQKSFS